MMDFETFKDKFYAEITSLSDGKFVFEDIKRSDGTTYTGLVKRESGINPVLNLEALYECYTDGKSFTNVVDEAIAILSKEKPLSISAEDFIHWDKVRHVLYPRLVPDNELNRAKPHTEVADLLIIYAVRAFADDNGIGEGVVVKELLDTWGIEVETLHEQAMENLIKDGYKSMNMMGAFTSVSNKYKTRGAIEVLNPEVIEEFSDMYIIPSSLDEILFISKDTAEPEALKAMLYEVNESAVEEENRLSYNVYEYRDGNLVVATS